MNYKCPYCNQSTTITAPNHDKDWVVIKIGKVHLTHSTQLGLRYDAIACPNNECKRLFLSVEVTKAEQTGYSIHLQEGLSLEKWQLWPESLAKSQPDYIPKPILEDYYEACRIRDLSPKASAALARRCLQGMIRDFYKISLPTLAKEIAALEGKIPSLEWQAIDGLRKIGNIGAHMESDVNLIIDIDKNEAQKLLAFVEYLFTQWYVKRHDDEENLKSIQAIAGLKQAQKKVSGSKTDNSSLG